MKNKSLRPWKTLSKQTILDHNHFLKVENHVVELPDGTIIPDWAWVAYLVGGRVAFIKLHQFFE